MSSVTGGKDGDGSLEDGHDRSTTSMPTRCQLLDLPSDILSQIASYLPLPEMLSSLSLNRFLLDLTQSHLSPIPSVIHQLLLDGPPYPPILAKLPSLSLFFPQDGETIFIDLLIRARPKWILERLELGRWREAVWKKAFERRFLPSWKRFKGDGDSWRAFFLRTLGRLEHRNLGCTHEESWTRFLTLHRNGSASINRIYSRLFDPYEIYDELKHQNNFASQPTQVRVVVHLQDVRIIALGVLLPQPSLFVNPNAHLLLHPPLLRGLAEAPEDVDEQIGASKQLPVARTPTAAAAPSSNTNEAYFPLAQSISPSGSATTIHGLGEGALPSSSAAVPASSPSLRSTITKAFSSGRSRRASTSGDGPDEAGGSRLGGILTQVRSRDSDDGRRRTWNFGRSRTGSSGTPVFEVPATEPRRSIETVPASMPTLPEIPSPPPFTTLKSPPTPPRTPTLPSRRHRKPYPTLMKPLPLSTHALFPNYTPSVHPSYRPAREVDPSLDADKTIPSKIDRRSLHFEVEDDSDGAIWSAGEAFWGGDGTKMAEWDAIEGIRKRWVGPMILIAQLHPSDRVSAQPQGADPYGPVEGPNVDLGPKGMYVSLGFEDLDAIMGWVELRVRGAHVAEARRGGLGFDRGDVSTRIGSELHYL